MSVPAARPSRRASRHSLSLQQIVDAALGLVREHGLEALSMSRLADTLGVAAMTLYGYARNKDELLDAMTVRVVEEMYDDHVDLEGVPWHEEWRAHYTAVRRSLLRHPGLADLLFYRDQSFEFHRRARAQVLRHVERHVYRLVQEGVSADDAVRYFYGLSYWTVAFVVRETIAIPARESAADTDDSASWVSRLPSEFAALRSTEKAMATLASDEQFAFFLQTFLDGVNSRIETR